MKYAMPVKGGILSPHFGRSTEFMLIDTQDGNITGKETISIQAHSCGDIPRTLSGRGVNVVLAGGIGLTPLLAFDRDGIEVVSGVGETDPEKAVRAHINGTLVSGKDVCEGRKWNTIPGNPNKSTG
jgi:ATP-binding protein involved in chromosome partitioning